MTRRYRIRRDPHRGWWVYDDTRRALFIDDRIDLHHTWRRARQQARRLNRRNRGNR